MGLKGITRNFYSFFNSDEITGTKIRISPHYQNNLRKMAMLHEALHGIGLAHLNNDTIEDAFFKSGTSMLISPTISLKTKEEEDYYFDYGPRNYLLSEYDKTMVNILYSNYIKPGLRQQDFIRLINESKNNKDSVE
jgi:hypothetical protein